MRRPRSAREEQRDSPLSSSSCPILETPKRGPTRLTISNARALLLPLLPLASSLSLLGSALQSECGRLSGPSSGAAGRWTIRTVCWGWGWGGEAVADEEEDELIVRGFVGRRRRRRASEKAEREGEVGGVGCIEEEEEVEGRIWFGSEGQQRGPGRTQRNEGRSAGRSAKLPTEPPRSSGAARPGTGTSQQGGSRARTHQVRRREHASSLKKMGVGEERIEGSEMCLRAGVVGG